MQAGRIFSNDYSVLLKNGQFNRKKVTDVRILNSNEKSIRSTDNYSFTCSAPASTQCCDERGDEGSICIAQSIPTPEAKNCQLSTVSKFSNKPDS
jgi:hypothetical protein